MIGIQTNLAARISNIVIELKKKSVNNRKQAEDIRHYTKTMCSRQYLVDSLQ